MVFCHGYAQQSETIESAQSGVAKDIQSIQGKGEQLQNKVFARIDSLSSKSATLLENATDSLNNLSSSIQGKLQSNPPSLNSFGGYVDSLQQKLNEIQTKGNQQLSNATEKVDKLTRPASAGRRIDSLQNVLSNKLQLDKLNKYTDAIPGADGIDKLQIPELNSKSIPGLEKLSLSDMKGLAGVKTEILKQVQDDGGGGIGVLASQVDDQLGEIGGLKNTDWINPDKSGYQIPDEVGEYTEHLKDPSNIDQAIDSKAAQMSEFQALNNETKELAAPPRRAGMKELPESML